VFVNVGPWKITFKRGKGDAEKGLPPEKLPMGDLVRYNSVDAVVQAQTWLAMRADLAVEQAVYDHDKELAGVCREMQIAGIKMDVERRNALSKAIKLKAAGLKGRMRRLAKMPNLHPMRLGEVRYALFTRLRAPMMEPTESGDPSTSSKTLEALKTKNDTRYGKFAGVLLNWRTAVKIKGTYLDAIQLWRGDRFHPTWKPYGTVSGRLSSRLQSVPRQEKLKTGEIVLESRVREVYIPREGCSFVYFDVSQAEMRFAAHLSGDENFINTCKGDVHTGNAKIVFPDEVKLLDEDIKGRGKPFRDIAKNCGFAVTYLAEAETVFQFLLSKGFPVKLPYVIAMLDRMRAGYTDYFKYVQSNIDWCSRHGYLRSAIIGRIRWLGWHSPPTEIANYMIQSGIADVMNIRTIDLTKRMPAGVALVAQIHDACIFEVPHPLVKEMKAMIAGVWAEPVKLASNGREFILPIDLKEGGRWSDFI
jgi:DNA polymerase-1